MIKNVKNKVNFYLPYAFSSNRLSIPYFWRWASWLVPVSQDRSSFCDSPQVKARCLTLACEVLHSPSLSLLPSILTLAIFMLLPARDTDALGLRIFYHAVPYTLITFTRLTPHYLNQGPVNYRSWTNSGLLLRCFYKESFIRTQPFAYGL